MAPRLASGSSSSAGSSRSDAGCRGGAGGRCTRGRPAVCRHCRARGARSCMSTQTVVIAASTSATGHETARPLVIGVGRTWQHVTYGLSAVVSVMPDPGPGLSRPRSTRQDSVDSLRCSVHKAWATVYHADDIRICRRVHTCCSGRTSGGSSRRGVTWGATHVNA